MLKKKRPVKRRSISEMLFGKPLTDREKKILENSHMKELRLHKRKMLLRLKQKDQKMAAKRAVMIRKERKERKRIEFDIRKSNRIKLVSKKDKEKIALIDRIRNRYMEEHHKNLKRRNLKHKRLKADRDERTKELRRGLLTSLKPKPMKKKVEDIKTKEDIKDYIKIR